MLFSFFRFVNLSQDIAENFKCSVCLDIFEAPLELPCGHIYCFECIRTYFGSSSTSECPECRGRIESQQVKPPNRKLLCILHNLNIKCEFASGGCNAVVKVENLITHTRECQFNRSTSRPSAPSSEPYQQNFENLMYLLSGNANDIDPLERLLQLQAILDAFALTIDLNEEVESEVTYNEERRGSSDDDEFLLHDETLSAHMLRWIGRFFNLVFIAFVVCFYAAQIAAIVISALKLNSCTQMPTLPHALMALGISTFLSNILETIRNCYFTDKLCVGLKFIQCFAFGSLIYLSVVVYSNLDYAINSGNSTLTCDSLVFEFSFWFVSAVLAIIGTAIFIGLIYLVCNNLRNIWSEWSGSYVLLSFIFSIQIIGMIISISTVTMGSIYFDSCAAIPRLTTTLVVFGSLGVVCWLIMLLSSDYKNCLLWLFVVSLLVSFILVAVSVHQNFPWTFSSHALHYTINCNITIYNYSFVIVCINYVIIGATICMYFIYAGIFASICDCLFFR